MIQTKLLKSRLLDKLQQMVNNNKLTLYSAAKDELIKNLMLQPLFDDKLKLLKSEYQLISNKLQELNFLNITSSGNQAVSIKIILDQRMELCKKYPAKYGQQIYRDPKFQSNINERIVLLESFNEYLLDIVDIFRMGEMQFTKHAKKGKTIPSDIITSLEKQLSENISYIKEFKVRFEDSDFATDLLEQLADKVYSIIRSTLSSFKNHKTHYNLLFIHELNSIVEIINELETIANEINEDSVHYEISRYFSNEEIGEISMSYHLLQTLEFIKGQILSLGGSKLLNAITQPSKSNFRMKPDSEEVWVAINKYAQYQSWMEGALFTDEKVNWVHEGKEYTLLHFIDRITKYEKLNKNNCNLIEYPDNLSGDWRFPFIKLFFTIKGKDVDSTKFNDSRRPHRRSSGRIEFKQNLQILIERLNAQYSWDFPYEDNTFVQTES